MGWVPNFVGFFLESEEVAQNSVKLPSKCYLMFLQLVLACFWTSKKLGTKSGNLAFLSETMVCLKR